MELIVLNKVARCYGPDSLRFACCKDDIYFCRVAIGVFHNIIRAAKRLGRIRVAFVFDCMMTYVYSFCSDLSMFYI